MADWILAYSHWYNSPVFLPGLALAILFSNIFQLSYLAQAYSTSHCVSTTFIAVIWIIAGICGFSCMRFMNEYTDFMINNYSFVCSNFCRSYCLVRILGEELWIDESSYFGCDFTLFLRHNHRCWAFSSWKYVYILFGRFLCSRMPTTGNKQGKFTKK